MVEHPSQPTALPLAPTGALTDPFRVLTLATGPRGSALRATAATIGRPVPAMLPMPATWPSSIASSAQVIPRTSSTTETLFDVYHSKPFRSVAKHLLWHQPKAH